MPADNLVHRYIETINRKDAAGFAALFALDTILHDPFFPEPTKGRDAVRTMIEGILQAFSDMTWTQVGDLVDGGDRVAFVVGVEGTNDGPLAMPAGMMPPTGNAISYEAAVFLTLDSDGLVGEERDYFDATGVGAQLGIIG